MDSHHQRRYLTTLVTSMKVVSIYCTLICLLVGSGADEATTNPQIFNSLLLTRCRALCIPHFLNNTCKEDCAKEFMQNKDNGKLGDCPRPFPHNLIQQNCSTPCNGADYECPDTQKCCLSKCGLTCQMPQGLERKMLPPTPKNLKLTTSNRLQYRKVLLEWEMPLDLDQFNVVFFELQSRSHAGDKFDETQMNRFQQHKVLNFYEEKTPRIRICTGIVQLNPKRWYEFRVASVSNLGTRGFAITKPFKLPKMPNPPATPKNLTLDRFRLGVNNTLVQKVTWNLPKSDIPVGKYRITWSLLINDTTMTNSILKHSASVAEPKRHFVIKELLPNSMYYLQIQAVSMFGIKRLKSEAATQLINTTLTPDLVRQLYNKPQSVKKSAAVRENGAANHREIVTIVPTENDDFRIKFVANRRFGLVVRAEMRTSHERIRVELCNGTDACLTDKTKTKTVFTINKRPHLDFIKLNFNHKYTIGFKLLAKKTYDKPDYDYKNTFVTPKCMVYRKTFKKLDIKCPTVTGNGTETNKGPAMLRRTKRT